MAFALRNERERIEWLRSQLDRPHPHVCVGIGDDAAVLEPFAGAPVLSVDAAVEGVHFELGWLAPHDVGWRAVAAATSDLAAMGARPRAALLALALPIGLEEARFEALVRGADEAARAHGLVLVGGNLARADRLSVTTTVVGELHGPPLLRSGARPGDVIGVVGVLGAAALGLELLRTGRAAEAFGRPFVEAFARPRAAIEAGLALAGRARSAIDVSDGFYTDLDRLAHASGVSVHVDVDALPRLPDHDAVARAVGRDPLEVLLGGGEDYALIYTSAPEHARELPGVLVGHCLPLGEPSRLVDRHGRSIDRRPEGFDHFR
ncbi:MAG: thiamine-phosphate kinase [Myxococcota bacterium]|nr:thiamine-phosphate kinase [Myxococcota bacterium]MDW8363300.1 thiamine-phosphate kinase [Myxococcales bacterium]